MLVEQACLYLSNGDYPSGASSDQKRSIRRKAKKLRVRNGDIIILPSSQEWLRGILVLAYLHVVASYCIGSLCFGTGREEKNNGVMSQRSNFRPFWY